MLIGSINSPHVLMVINLISYKICSMNILENKLNTDMFINNLLYVLMVINMISHGFANSGNRSIFMNSP